MSAEKGSSKADTLVKVVLVFFISLLSFSVGTFVGKQVSDSDHRRMALEGEYKAERQVASTDGKTEGQASEKISPKEVESLTEEFVAKEKNAGAETAAKEDGEEKALDKAPEKAAPEQAAVEKSENEKPDTNGYKNYKRGAAKEAKQASKETPAKDVKEVADKVAEGVAPTNGETETRKPSSTPLPSVASSAIGKYTVQVGSYADETEAKNHAAELKGKGWNSFYTPAAVSGHTWYRVSVGLFSNMKSANEFRAQFMKDANTKSAIVRKIVE
jgi:cell division protein FtsN